MDPDAALQNLRDGLRAWQEAVAADSRDAEQDAAANAIGAAAALDGWLSHGGFPPTAWAEPSGPPDADAAYARYAAAASLFARAIEYKVARRILADFPTATGVLVVGEYGEDNSLHVRLTAINGPSGLLADRRSGNALWDDLTDEVDPDLDWLGQLEPDDWTGPHQTDLETLLGPPLSTADPTSAHPTQSEGTRP